MWLPKSPASILACQKQGTIAKTESASISQACARKNAATTGSNTSCRTSVSGFITPFHELDQIIDRSAHPSPNPKARSSKRPSKLPDPPAFAHRRFQVSIGFRVVGHFHSRAVPLDLSFKSNSDRSQQRPFNE